MKITFIGAVQTVTGSQYLLEANDKKILVDCGLFQGKKDLRLRNWAKFQFNPSEIDAVLLTHAHIDHSGMLPKLVKQGFKGKIYATQATIDLCEILLADSAYLMEEEARYANLNATTKHTPALPLYTHDDVSETLKHFVARNFNEPFGLFDTFKIQYHRVGHILGAAFIRIEANDTSITFSGDVGRPNDLIMKAPHALTKTDYLVVESTYGDRQHSDESPFDQLANQINETHEKGGTIVIPAFAVGRSQMLLYLLHQLILEERIPQLPIFMDSPLARGATEIFYKHLGEHRLSMETCQAMRALYQTIDSAEASKALTEQPESKIILSASGMATGGRVLHHIKHYAPDPNNSIIFTGFQSPGTRGELLIHDATSIKLLGETVPIRAKVININASAHGDHLEIADWMAAQKTPPRMCFVTHGEPAASEAFAKYIQDNLNWDSLPPQPGQTIEL